MDVALVATMLMKTSLPIRAIPLVALVLAAVAAHAAPIAISPNQTLIVPATNAGLGTLVVTSTYAFTGVDVQTDYDFSGVLTTSVYRQANNTLAFVNAVSNDAKSLDGIERYSLTGYKGFSTAIEQGTPNGSILAASGSRSANGDVMAFSYAPSAVPTFGSIMPGTSSRYTVVYTNATTYTLGSGQFIAGGVAVAPAYAPQAVPEPASVAALGVGALGLLRRRKRA